MIAGFLCDVMYGLIDFMGEFMNNIFGLCLDINVSIDLSGVLKYVHALALVLVMVVGLKKGMDVYVFQTDGDADSDPLELITRVMQAVAVICCNNYIFSTMLRISDLVVSDFTASVTDRKYTKHSTKLLDGIVENMSSDAAAYTVGFLLANVLFLLIIMISVLMFCYVAGKRAAELVLMKIMCPLFALDLITTSRERWNTFFTSYAVTFFGYGIQTFCWCMFSKQYADFTLTSSPKQIFVVLGWLAMTLGAPKWLEKFVYSSGLKEKMTNLGRSAVYMVPYMLRR